MRFEKSSPMPVSAQKLFDWHGSPGAFSRLTPPWQTVELLREDPGLQTGKRIDLKLSTPLGKRVWRARHIACEDGRGFTDTQDEGPFKHWKHEHVFEERSASESVLKDIIEFKLPLGNLGSSFVTSQLERAFRYRHWVTRRDLELKASLPSFRCMKIAITGGTGFLGSQLRGLLQTQGHTVSVVTRSKRSEDDILWDPASGDVDLVKLEGLDAVVHLAGENLSSGRWSDERKKRLWSSRVDSTRLLADSFAKLEQPPKVFLSGSGIGVYGSDPELGFDETSPVGTGFLAELCEAWEAEALRAENMDTRVCLLRTGVALDPRGGALRQMLPAFKLGAGGPLGDGQQWFPWISSEDWIGAVCFLLLAEEAKGPVNLVSPGVLRQREFARCLGSALKRPAFLPAPKFALKIALGEMADEALLSSIRAKPMVLEKLGYTFADPSLEDLLSRLF